MKDQYEQESLAVVDKLDSDILVVQQAEHIRNLEERLSQLEEASQQDKGVSDALEDTVPKGDIGMSNDGTGNVIYNQHELSDVPDGHNSKFKIWT